MKPDFSQTMQTVPGFFDGGAGVFFHERPGQEVEQLRPDAVFHFGQTPGPVFTKAILDEGEHRLGRQPLEVVVPDIGKNFRRGGPILHENPEETLLGRGQPVSGVGRGPFGPVFGQRAENGFPDAEKFAGLPEILALNQRVGDPFEVPDDGADGLGFFLRNVHAGVAGMVID